MTDRAGQLRGALLGILAALDEGPPVFAPVRGTLDSLVEVVFTGQEVSGTLLQLAVTQTLGVYFQAASSGVSDELILARISSLHSLALDDPARVAEIEVAVPRDLVGKPLRASIAPPLAYVLDDGAVVLARDPDPAPEVPGFETDLADVETVEPDDDEAGSTELEDPHSQSGDASTSFVPEHHGQTQLDTGATNWPDWKVDEEAAEPILLYRFYRDIASSAFDHMSLVARHRMERRMSESLDEEEWIVQLSDAVANIGHESLTAAQRHFIGQLDGDPFDLWGSAFFLSCVEGLPAVRLLDQLLGLVSPTDSVAATTIADAVSKGTSPELRPMLRDWAVSPIATKRAIAMKVQCRRQEMSVEMALRGISDPCRQVRLLTLDGLRDLDVSTPELGRVLLPMLRNLWRMHDAQVAWQSVLTACWFGLGEPYRAWRRNELVTLGEYEMDLIVLVGDAGDLQRLRTLVETTDLSARSLNLMARFGHPAAIPVLIHGLKDEEFREEAAESLEILLGPRLDSDARLDPQKWLRLISTLSIHPEKRLWHGEPFRPSTFSREVDWGRASLANLEQRLEEIRARTCRGGMTALHGWHAANQGRLNQVCDELRRIDGHYPAGTWTSALTLAE